jgi:hypothetical protein
MCNSVEQNNMQTKCREEGRPHKILSDFVPSLSVKYCKKHKVARHHADEHSRKANRALPSRILPTEKNSKPTQWCTVCNMDRDNKLYKCPNCELAMYMDKHFEAYHTIKNSWGNVSSAVLQFILLILRNAHDLT